MLGIPTVRDRVVQQTLNDILTPIFEAQFHPSSFGYRPHRGCHDAINKATMFIRRYGLQHVVDMDLSKCFDKLDHELIIKSIGKRITDSSVLGLLKQFLTSGVMINNHWQATEILEKTLKLSVNQSKTHIAHSDEGVKFLGVEIGSTYTRIQAKKRAGFKQKVKQMTKRNSGLALCDIIKAINPLLRGFSHYFRIANAGREFKKLAGWVRRRLRSIQLRLWKKPTRLHRRLKELGYKPPFKWIKMTRWRNAASPLASYAMPNKWFEELGLVNLEEVKTGYVFSHYAEWRCT